MWLTHAKGISALGGGIWLGFRRYGKWNRVAELYKEGNGGIRKLEMEKLNLLTVDSPSVTTIRCGFLGAESSALLDCLVLDVYSTERAWMGQFLGRNRSKNLVKYGEEFSVSGPSGIDELRTYYIPSPWLKGLDCEILESSEEKVQKDGCHFYVMRESLPEVLWPRFPITPKNIDEVHAKLNGSQIDALHMLQATLRFIEDKSTVNEYLRILDSSNFLPLSKQLKDRLGDKNAVFSDLEHAVLSEIYRSDDSVSQYEKLVTSRSSVDKQIEQWSQDAHKELQKCIEPLLMNFSSKQLSLWKVYSYTESKLQLKLREMCNITNDLEMVQSLSHIYGSLNIPQDRLEIIDSKYTQQQVPELHKRINGIVYKNFFQLQLPLILVSVAGTITNICSPFSMGALGSFGVVLGLKRVKDSWFLILEQFREQIMEQCRIGIENNKSILIEKWKNTYAKRESELREKVSLIKTISDELK